MGESCAPFPTNKKEYIADIGKIAKTKTELIERIKKISTEIK